MDATDIIEIHQLLGLYGHIVDAGEWDRFGELFTEDVVVRTAAGWRLRRRECRSRWQFTPGSQDHLAPHRRTF